MVHLENVHAPMDFMISIQELDSSIDSRAITHELHVSEGIVNPIE